MDDAKTETEVADQFDQMLKNDPQLRHELEAEEKVIETGKYEKISHKDLLRKMNTPPTP